MKTNLLIALFMFALLSCNHREKLSDAYGNFEVEDFLLAAESTGKLLEMNVNEGNEITKGERIAVVDTIQVVLQLKQLKAQKAAVSSKMAGIHAQIETLKQQKENLEVNYNRVINLVESGAATVQQRDDLEGKLKVIDKQIAATKTQLTSVQKELYVFDKQEALLREQLSRCYVESPVSGVILEKYLKTGEMAVAGKPLVKIADLSTLDLRCYVSGNMLPLVKLGDEVRVLIDAPDGSMDTLSGPVSWIADEAEFSPKIIQTKEERVKLVYAVKVRVKNDGRIKAGMPGEMQLLKNGEEK
ncbi:MAG: efflux RND transporter periplasmic adaptor subunit [Prolixibacteraceae bacterium]|nr:efflux RND transporter periplasmic adaptor subunit [Prolixibacteraceae bacterium]